MSQENTLVTYEILSQAIVNKMGVTRDIANDLSFRVLNYFGYDDEIIDNVLDPDDRRMFYFLQDIQLLSTHWEEAILPNGRTWRVFYWALNIPKILEFASPPKQETVTELGLYDSLPADVWSRQTA